MLERTSLSELALSAHDLCITEEERAAIARGETPTQCGFSMAVVFSKLSCVTVGCIRGWARHLSGDECLFNESLRSMPQDKANNLSDLFTPDGWRYGLYNDKDAAEALYAYLTTGVPRWPMVFHKA